ncbi:hypothetical protein AYR62_11065 [Secundilactobacillus paracollinoides]|uniref:Uncharacterized protein n=1 Tax=Secundilactobacillus paracollinoides TaxID=240427 RepID=A0A1B2IXX4_9LACO|nr:hypothetical protein [Secundilactobacillus paracollinoides]ANZ64571.1 hypothetical protein AYR62_11065 [Secundilactobacillus paracollinoides]ANZ66926.1 hypothetical protein AYR63_07140 [Secundilactobacillus paracollinoides]KRL76977.1 hypothetical protein FC17_GL001431 [Secundilactobacillus paracollinoides DSM 15502 = JCM 11969]
MIKQATKNATMWMIIGLILDIVFEPIGFLFHHPMDGLFGLIHNVLQSPNVGAATLFSVGALLIVWVLLVLFFILIGLTTNPTSKDDNQH